MKATTKVTCLHSTHLPEPAFSPLCSSSCTPTLGTDPSASLTPHIHAGTTPCHLSPRPSSTSLILPNPITPTQLCPSLLSENPAPHLQSSPVQSPPLCPPNGTLPMAPNWSQHSTP